MESAKSWPPLDTATVPSMDISLQCVVRWSISVPDAFESALQLYWGWPKIVVEIPRKVPGRDGAMEEIRWIHVDNSRG